MKPIVSVVRIIPQTEKEKAIRKTGQTRWMLLLNCEVCGKKKLTFINTEELNNFKNIWKDQFKMN